jgi:hypothetical protein
MSAEFENLHSCYTHTAVRSVVRPTRSHWNRLTTRICGHAGHAFVSCVYVRCSSASADCCTIVCHSAQSLLPHHFATFDLILHRVCDGSSGRSQGSHSAIDEGGCEPVFGVWQNTGHTLLMPRHVFHNLHNSCRSNSSHSLEPVQSRHRPHVEFLMRTHTFAQSELPPSQATHVVINGRLQCDINAELSPLATMLVLLSLCLCMLSFDLPFRKCGISPRGSWRKNLLSG